MIVFSYLKDRPKVLGGMLTGIISVFPGIILFSRRASDICLFLLVLSAFWVILSGGVTNSGSFKAFLVRYWPLCFAMSSMLVAVLLNQIFITGFRAKFYDLPLRFLVVPLIVYVLLNLSSGKMKHVQWGMMISPFICATFMYVMSNGGTVRPYIEEQTGYLLICFTNLCLLLGFLSFATIKWDRLSNKWVFLFKISSLLASICTVVLSQTRASYISTIVLSLVVAGLFLKKNKIVVFVVMASLVVLLVSFFSFHSIEKRINDAKSDYILWENGNKDTSIGIRLQLYQASWRIFQENILFGVGRGEVGFDREMKKMAEKGIISSMAARSGHSHNELLNQMVSYGFFGGAAVILCTFLPIFYFFPYRHSKDNLLKTVSWMGICFCIGFFLFGLSDSIYIWRGSVNYYVVILSILLALLIRRKDEISLGTTCCI